MEDRYPYLKNRSFEQLYHIGNEYLLGRTVGKDEVKAFHVYEIAAKKGNLLAINRLGECYENGLGVEKAPAEAVKWYRKAAVNGSEEAKKALKRLGVE